MHRIIPYCNEHRKAVIATWEASVRATHDFLKPEDIDFYKDIVASLDFSAFHVVVLVVEEQISGFMGLADGKVEMLFLHPDRIGKGYGKALLQFATQDLNATAVDVNEQNRAALRFYEAAGFRVVGRTETDDCGKPYPILRLQLPGSPPSNAIRHEGPF